MSNAREFLGKLQQESRFTTPLQAIQAGHQADQAHLRGSAKRLGVADDVVQKLVSKFGRSTQTIADKMLADLCETVERAAQHLSFQLPTERPVIGTLPTGRVNAMAIRVPESKEHIIAFDSGMFSFAHLMGKAICWSIPHRREQSGLSFSLDIEDWRKKVDLDPESATRFRQVLLGSVLLGDPRISAPYKAPAHVAAIAEGILRTFELFVVGHEYGHIGHGHLSGAVTRRAAIGATSVEEAMYSWAQEFEADNAGLALLLAATTDGDLRTSLAGADFFFSCVEATERAQSILQGEVYDEDVGSMSHPPPAARREALREVGRQDCRDLEGSTAVLSLAEFLAAAVRYMCDATAPLLEELRVSPPDWRRMTRLVGLDDVPQGEMFVAGAMAQRGMMTLEDAEAVILPTGKSKRGTAP